MTCSPEVISRDSMLCAWMSVISDRTTIGHDDPGRRPDRCQSSRLLQDWDREYRRKGHYWRTHAQLLSPYVPNTRRRESNPVYSFSTGKFVRNGCCCCCKLASVALQRGTQFVFSYHRWKESNGKKSQCAKSSGKILQLGLILTDFYFTSVSSFSVVNGLCFFWFSNFLSLNFVTISSNLVSNLLTGFYFRLPGGDFLLG